MELLLNLIWLMLALPAVLIWRRERASSRIHDRSHALILLCCVLALLFPVVSATDDLHPISAEIEDSALSKRVVKPSPAARSSASPNAGGLHARPVDVAFFRSRNETSEPVSEFVPLVPVQTQAGTTSCRPPPAA